MYFYKISLLYSIAIITNFPKDCTNPLILHIYLCILLLIFQMHPEYFVARKKQYYNRIIKKKNHNNINNFNLHLK